MNYGKAIELFLVNGTAESIITAELSNWNGKAIKIPRIEVNECTREDINSPGVYFLFCKEDDGTDSVYIGESENVKERLKQHIKDYNNDKEKYYWITAVVFTGRDLNKALIRYLEDRLVQITKECKRYKVLTKNTYSNTVLKESQISVMEEFLNNIKILINTLGFKVLEPITHQLPTSQMDDEKLYFKSGSAYAEGIVTTEGFVIFAGAIINEKVSEKSLSKGAIALRNKLLASDSVKDYKTVKDILFSSSSAAVDFVAGYSLSGPRNWKNKNGITLKELENKE
ncbi:GIY-YIG nuclease family protein [Floccifex porci]|uniref:GIY-YIG nuclease family protein n=1 Tax=Floccifex porci TaxID=2606629 RepID=A0A7X2N167_9FIRM|nr:GIY-YIG nuclease family protein [Floccifex porci]MSS00609.1 GIY-YIG nuclease family protein [Floccifex porci]